MAGSLHNTKIMVVDDDENTCELLRFALEREGATVVVAQSVGKAIETFRRRPPHAVVADIRLGSSDGYALIKAIRAHNVEYRGFTPAIAVTGYASSDDEERALESGFNAYFAKPFDPCHVVTTIKKILSGSAGLAA